MAENSSISWCDHTFSPWIGCTRISPACDGCYAAAQFGLLGRFGPARVEWGGPGKGEGTRSRTAPSTWKLPRKWDREAAKEVERWRMNPFAHPSMPKPSTFVFCSSLADVFDNAVPPDWRRDLFDLIRETPNLTWLLLTKRPGNIVKLFREATEMDQQHDPLSEYWPPNAAIGCTVEDRRRKDQNINLLLQAAAQLDPAFTFLSCEPLLEDLGDLNAYFRPNVSPGLEWIITGGETDQKTEEGMHHARPANPAWFRSLRDQCAAAGVPFQFKQWGEWQPGEVTPEEFIRLDDGGRTLVAWPDGSLGFGSAATNGGRGTHLYRFGKAHDPCTLDGVKHDARPEVSNG